MKTFPGRGGGWRSKGKEMKEGIGDKHAYQYILILSVF